MPRARDQGSPTRWDVIMLCGPCHRSYDSGQLDIYPCLTVEERRAAVRRAGGPGLALRALMGSAWRAAPGALLDHRLDELTGDR